MRQQQRSFNPRHGLTGREGHRRRTLRKRLQHQENRCVVALCHVVDVDAAQHEINQLLFGSPNVGDVAAAVAIVAAATVVVVATVATVAAQCRTLGVK